MYNWVFGAQATSSQPATNIYDVAIASVPIWVALIGFLTILVPLIFAVLKVNKIAQQTDGLLAAAKKEGENTGAAATIKVIAAVQSDAAKTVEVKVEPKKEETK